MTSELHEPRYLGDGVYARFDGFQVWLWLEGARGEEIALEPATMMGLMDFVADIKKRNTDAHTSAG